MIALWMAYAVALSALVGAIAVCADRLCRLAGRATRIAWGAGLVVSFAAPLALALRPAPSSTPSADAPAAAPRATAALDSLLAHARVVRDVESADVWRTVDDALLAVWVVTSGVALGWLGLSRRQLRLSLRRWTPASIDGEPVLVAPDAGPAAVAERGGQIVLPAWALAMNDERRTLLLAHERAHLAARDPQFVAGATGLLALMPWNPALWWQYRRLRLAIEIDCDARVLRRHPNVARYGALLLDVARRGATSPRFAAAFSAPTPTTSLERRIRSMTERRPRHVVLRALGAAALGAGLVAAACEAPHPTGLRPESQVPASRIRSAVIETKGEELDLARLKRTIAEQLPAVARGTGQAQLVYIVEDGSGRIVKSAATPAPAAANGSAAGPQMREKVSLDAALGTIDARRIATVDIMKLAPGRVAPDSTAVVWIRLKTPGEAATAETAGRERHVDSLRFTALRARYVASDSARERAVGRQFHVENGNVRVVAGQPIYDSVRYSGLLARYATSDSVRERTVGPSYHFESGRVRVSADQPIYVIDGAEVAPDAEGHSPLDKLSPSDVAAVSVLKGAAAVAQYGERARNGVIQVTTKARKTAKY